MTEVITELPDFKRLMIQLTNSGVNKWNPPLYDILVKLINASAQSQDILDNNQFVLNVDPKGAILGDGTKSKPVKVNVDNISIQINASNQLGTIAAGGGAISFATITLTNTQVNTLNSAPIAFVAAPGPGKTNMPVFGLTHINQPVGHNASRTASIVYIPNNTPSMNINELCSNVALDRWWFTPMALQVFDNLGGTPVNIDNQPFYVQSSGDTVGGSGANSVKILFAYMTVATP